MVKDINQLCASCPVCQKACPASTTKAPLYPLTHLNNLKDSHGRLARWALTLQPYNFTVKHRSGKANSNADGLSRDPSAAEVGEMSEPPRLLPVTLPVTRQGK